LHRDRSCQSLLTPLHGDMTSTGRWLMRKPVLLDFSAAPM